MMGGFYCYFYTSFTQIFLKELLLHLCVLLFTGSVSLHESLLVALRSFVKWRWILTALSWGCRQFWIRSGKKTLELCLTNCKSTTDMGCILTGKLISTYYTLHYIEKDPACDITLRRQLQGPEWVEAGSRDSSDPCISSNYSLVLSWRHPDYNWNLISLSPNLLGDISINFKNFLCTRHIQ